MSIGHISIHTKQLKLNRFLRSKRALKIPVLFCLLVRYDTIPQNRGDLAWLVKLSSLGEIIRIWKVRVLA